MAGARIQLFGPLRMTLDGRELPPPPNRKSRALLAYLLLHADEQQPRERLTGLFWSDVEERRARQSLRQALSEVRRALDGIHEQAWIDSDDLSVTLRCRCPVDVHEFRRAAESVVTGSASSDAIEQTLAFAEAELLPECYDDWCLDERSRLRDQRTQALEALLATAQGDHARVRRLGAGLLAADPLREDVHRTLMEAAARAGDRAGALRQYAACEAALERELGTRPAPETVQLYERIRDGLVGRAAGEADEPLVGRAEELAALTKLLATAARGRTAAAVLEGPPGIGKSRLLTELAATARARGFAVVEAGSDGDDRAEPYGAWVAATRSLLQREPELLRSVQTAALPALARLIPETRHLVTTTPDRQPTRADLFAGVLAVIRSATATRPLLVLLDDLQWAGQDAALLFEHVRRRAGRSALCLVGAMRDGGTGGPFGGVAERLQRDSLAQHVPLGPLGAAAVHVLLRQICGNEAVADSLAGVTFAESEGNPLHVIELWRAMQEQGRIERDASGRWHWRGRLDGQRERLPLPLRIRAVIGARLAALAPHVREALTVGAVIGRAWEMPLLERAVEAPGGSWQPAFDQAVEHGLLRRTRDGYAFVHDVIRETVEREIDEAAARRLHLRVGEALERLSVDAGEAHAEALLHHFERAGPRGIGRAFAYAWQAALRAKTVFAHEHAIARFELALDYAEGGLVDDAKRLGEIRAELAEALARAGRVAAARRAAESALAAYLAAGDPDAELAARVRLAGLFDANVDPHAVLYFCGDEHPAEESGAGAAGPLVGERLLQACLRARAAGRTAGVARRCGATRAHRTPFR